MEQTWKDIYNRKLITAAQAAAMVQNGDSFCAVTREPKTILRELGKRKDLKNVTYYCSQTNFLGELMGLQNEGTFCQSTIIHCYITNKKFSTRHGNSKVSQF